MCYYLFVCFCFMKKYIILDIETTGLSKFKHWITEIAAVKYDGEKILDEYQTLVNPWRHIPKQIEKLTGISNEMVADARDIWDVFPEFLEFISDDILVAHNAPFDMWFLGYYYYKTYNEQLEKDVLCTRRLANRILPELKSKSLWSLCEYYDIHNERAHRALADARATTILLKNFLEFMKANKVEDQQDILELQHKNRYQCFC